MNSYVKNVADRFNITQHIECNMTWTKAAWLEETAKWRVELRNTKTGKVSIRECKLLISATGHMIDAKGLDVPGKSEFKGNIVHSSKWTSGIDLQGKRVVVLGNGSTAVQVVPAILKEASQCTQIQRVSTCCFQV